MTEYCVQSRKPGDKWQMVGDVTYSNRSDADEAYYRLENEKMGEFYDDITVSSIRDAQRIVNRYNAVKDLQYRVAQSAPRVWIDADGDWS